MPLSPIACRAALMRVSSAASETVRPSHTAVEQVILTDDALAIADQIFQEIEDLGFHGTQNTASAQFAPSGIEDAVLKRNHVTDLRPGTTRLAATLINLKAAFSSS